MTMTTYEHLLQRVICDGIAEVQQTYADPDVHHKRDGAIEGFEACRDKTPDALIALWTEANHAAEESRREQHSSEDAHDSWTKRYWRLRYKTLQIEWVCNVVSVGLVQSGSAPLLGWLPTARAAMKYAEIVGVRAENHTVS